MLISDHIVISHAWENMRFTCIYFLLQLKLYNYLPARDIPIIGSAKISAIDIAFFTNIGIGTEQ